MSRYYHSLARPIQLHANAAALPEVIGTARGLYTASAAGGEIPLGLTSVRQWRCTILQTVLAVPTTWTDVFLRAWINPQWDGTVVNGVPTGSTWEWVDVGTLLTDAGASAITIPYNRPILNWSPAFGRLAVVGTPPVNVDVWLHPVIDEDS